MIAFAISQARDRSGQYLILVRAYAALLVSPQILTVEDIAEALPAMLRAFSRLHADEQGIDDHTNVAMLEVTTCG